MSLSMSSVLARRRYVQELELIEAPASTPRCRCLPRLPAQTAMHTSIGMTAAQTAGFTPAHVTARRVRAVAQQARSGVTTLGWKERAISSLVRTANPAVEALVRRAHAKACRRGWRAAAVCGAEAPSTTGVAVREVSTGVDAPVVPVVDSGAGVGRGATTAGVPAGKATRPVVHTATGTETPDAGAKHGDAAVPVTEVPSPQPPPTQPHVVITGAAQGIGAALAAEFSAAGYAVTGVDMRWSDGAATASPCWRRLVRDLSRRDQLLRLVEQLQSGPLVDLVVHNAGVNFTARFGSGSASQLQLMLDVNVTAPYILTTQLLAKQVMRRPRDGPCKGHGPTARSGFVFVSSLARYVLYPGSSVYAATKCAVAALSRCLRAGGWRTLTVYPGPTRTQQVCYNRCPHAPC